MLTTGLLYHLIFIDSIRRFFDAYEDTDTNDKRTKNFVFVANINLTKRNVLKIVVAGRSRWKIENQGFNNQKNIRYNIEHACCLDYQAIKELKAGIKEISSRILESFRREPLTPEDISQLNQHMKIHDL